jgi:hypothetical protein
LLLAFGRDAEEELFGAAASLSEDGLPPPQALSPRNAENSRTRARRT